MADNDKKRINLYQPKAAGAAKHRGELLHVGPTKETEKKLGAERILKITHRKGTNAVNMIGREVDKGIAGQDLIYNSAFNLCGNRADFIELLRSTGYTQKEIDTNLAVGTLDRNNYREAAGEAFVTQYKDLADRYAYNKFPGTGKAPQQVLLYSLDDLVSIRKDIGNWKMNKGDGKAGAKAPGAKVGGGGTRRHALAERLASAETRGKGLKIKGYAQGKSPAPAVPNEGTRTRYRVLTMPGGGGHVITDDMADLRAFGVQYERENPAAQGITDALVAMWNDDIGKGMAVPQPSTATGPSPIGSMPHVPSSPPVLPVAPPIVPPVLPVAPPIVPPVQQVGIPSAVRSPSPLRSIGVPNSPMLGKQSSSPLSSAGVY